MSSNTLRGTVHAVIPDTQIRPGEPIDHLQWIGWYLGEKQPDRMVQLGDWFDMPSLSSHASLKDAEGARLRADIDAGNHAWEVLNDSIIEGADDTETGEWWEEDGSERIYLLGNHEQRLLTWLGNHPSMEGMIGFDSFEHPGWDRYDFLEPVVREGIYYIHYIPGKLNGRPLGGRSVETRLKTVGRSFTHGHQQVFLYGRYEGYGVVMQGLVAGNCYLHDEPYRGATANDEWRGIIMKHHVRDGQYDIKQVSLDSLCRRYVGCRLEDYTPTLLAGER
jgi:hypothetical protein